jgi:hypothetical protein
MPLPPFAQGRRWHRRASRCPQIGRRVWHDLDNDREYERDPNPLRGMWHEIDWRRCWYRDIDRTTGAPVPGSEGRWRPLQ